ncbi:hypothetical protein SERLADRAFT_481018 [Serpula lacrymans var. lacrymans S7.9]|uniref:Sde2 ubiquitin domain-containing protein n=1 Tax=Serpula lacrymans var. lacrymans (strain S7.9) TaxID=578457 RepID=F8PE87_SERL9|nr:uncharacterized protein SERLADRAFT_481018 [Serpula lacrymans var. lacrymans S7.9]EGO18684.1 hypothetical protein SERLADRAFT_481018 [Serpula lacrymans var. lacrymans S7.9]
MSITVLCSSFPPFPTLSLSVPKDTPVGDLYGLLHDRYPDLPCFDELAFSPHSGLIPCPETSLSALHAPDADLSSFISLRLIPRLRGGKGGFGSQLLGGWGSHEQSENKQ